MIYTCHLKWLCFRCMHIWHFFPILRFVLAEMYILYMYQCIDSTKPLLPYWLLYDFKIFTQLAYSQLSHSLKSKSLPSVVCFVVVVFVHVVVTRYTFLLFDLGTSFLACGLLLPMCRKYIKMGHIDPFLMGQMCYYII